MCSHPVLSFLSARSKSSSVPSGSTASIPSTLPLRLPYRSNRRPPECGKQTTCVDSLQSVKGTLGSRCYQLYIREPVACSNLFTAHYLDLGFGPKPCVCPSAHQHWWRRFHRFDSCPSLQDPRAQQNPARPRAYPTPRAHNPRHTSLCRSPA